MENPIAYKRRYIWIRLYFDQHVLTTSVTLDFRGLKNRWKLSQLKILKRILPVLNTTDRYFEAIQSSYS
jgi:hypothetical protein